MFNNEFSARYVIIWIGYIMLLQLGEVKEFELESYESKYLIPKWKSYFNDEMAAEYQPILFNFKGIGSKPEPEGIYYRIISDTKYKNYCLQFYVYWEHQDCVGIKNHRYDYEPIFIFLRIPRTQPTLVVNGGDGDASSGNLTFHRAEIHSAKLKRRDKSDRHCSYKTSSEPYFPCGGENGKDAEGWYKRYPLATTIYFEINRPLMGIKNCWHAFSGSCNEIEGCRRLTTPLNKLEDSLLEEWYYEHYKSKNEEPFGHDVSNPFEFPYIKYFNPKPLFDEKSNNM